MGSRHNESQPKNTQRPGAPNAEWFWMLVSFGFLMAVFTEVYYHYFNAAIDE